VREVIYFKRAVYVRALQELGERAFEAGPPPRPDWLTDELLSMPASRAPRRRRRPSIAPPAADTGGPQHTVEQQVDEASEEPRE
jgi:hypothetical protein